MYAIWAHYPMDDQGKPETSPLLTISDAATLLNVSKATIRRWTNEGRLRCSRIGARDERRFHEADLMAVIRRPETSAVGPGKLAEAPGPTSAASCAHCCLISHTAEQEWQSLGPEILNSLEQGAQVLVIEDAYRKERLDLLLAEHDLDKARLLDTHALRCVSIEESYFLSGAMLWDRAVAFVESGILEAKARGFEKILVVGTGSWAGEFKGEDVVSELRKYELGLERMLARHPGARVLCPYVATQVSAAMIVQAFETHPVVQIQSTHLPRLLQQTAC